MVMSGSPGKNARKRSNIRPLIELAALEARVMMSAAHHAAKHIVFPSLDTEPAISGVIRELAASAFDTLAPALAAPTGNLPLSAIPNLHSHASSTHKVYLDFVGAPAFTWGGYSVPATPAYNQDSDPTTFTQPELNNIQEIWARVAEHYSPFDVDITTENPGNFNAYQNVRVLIGGSGSWYQSAGGVTYVGGYTINDLAHNFTTANVFPGQLSNGNPVYTAEAAAHEIGHMFGLQHQSSWSGNSKTAEYRMGSTDESPIMGDSYYATRGVWAQGTSTLGPTIIQDDLAVLSANNFGYRADDYGNNSVVAFPLPTSGTSISATGVIEQTTDTDWFSFSTQSGLVSLSVSPSSHGGMLDATLEIVNSSGAIVASADTSSLGESLSLNLPAGSYDAVVGSHGAYGDIGQYTLAGTIVNDPNFVPAPTNLIAARGSGAVVLTWTDNANNETAYLVQRSSDNGASWSTIATLPASSGAYSDSNVALGQVYAYRVIGANAFEQSQPSNNATIASTPSAPSNLTATALSARQVQLAWSASSGATMYRIEQSADNGANWTMSGSVAPTALTFTATALSAGTVYSFRVTATSTVGDSPASNVAMALTLPASPASVNAAPTSSSEITLTWAATTGAGGYRIERLFDTTWLLIGTVVGHSITYTDTNLLPDTLYQYRVRAFNSSGQSDVSAITQSQTYLATPTGLTASATSTSQIDLKWSPLDSAIGYQLDFSLNGGSTWNFLARITDPSNLQYTQNGLSAGVTYAYRLTAIGDTVNSLPSDAVTSITKPAAPASFSATAVAPTKVNVVWPAVTGAMLGYTVERSADGVEFAQIAHVAAEKLAYLDASAEENTTYFYRVLASNSSGDSAYTSIASATPSEAENVLPPSDLAASVISPDAVRIFWTDNSTNESGFAVQRSADGGATWNDLSTTGANTTSYLDRSAARGTNYLYRVQAANQWIASEYSAPATVLTPPADVSDVHVVAASTSRISIAWDDVATETRFDVEQEIGGVWTTLATIDSGTTTYTASDLESGAIYQFRVTAFNSSGAANPSSLLATITIPSAPSSLSAIAVSPTRINLAWQNVRGNAGYFVQRSDDAGANWTTIGTTIADVARYSDLNAVTGTMYSYRVFATNSAGTSVASPGASASATRDLAVLAPSDLSTWYDSGRVMLRWTDNAGNETGFIVQRSSDGGASFNDLTTIPAPDITSYSDLSADRGAQYVYKVIALNPWMQSGGTVSVMVTPPPDVTDVYINTIAATRIGLAWSDVAGESGFKIERSTDNVNFTEITSTDRRVTSFNDLTAAPGTRYYYRVRATGAGGDSGTSVGIGVSTPVFSASSPRLLPPTALRLFSKIPVTFDQPNVGPSLMTASQAIIVVSPSQPAAAALIDQSILHIIGDEITV
jgi:hypothetical protein